VLGYNRGRRPERNGEYGVYVAKLNTDYDDEEEAVHEAIWDAMVAGDVAEAFGRFYVVEGYIIIDKPTR
jgi:hypothetical protein